MNKQLTPRQREAITALADGLAFKHIADRMGIALATAENHIHQAQKALGIHNVAGLVSWHWAEKLKAANDRIAQLEAQLNYSKTFPRHD